MERGSSVRRPGQAGRWWLAMLLAVLLAPVGFTTARQAIFDLQQSPATGHAQVVTQGIAELPEGDVVWRVVERVARPRDEARPGRRVLGFVLATDEPVLLTNVSPEGNKDVARLAPGESFLVEPGTRQIRASLSGQETTYLSFELVPAADARDTNGGRLLFASDPFPAPTGKRDIDLVRNVLESGDIASVPDTGQPVAILATEGAIDILPGGGGRQTLEAGDSQVFEAGELEISPATPSTSAGARAHVAAMTSALQTEGGNRSAYVVAVIGPEIPPAPTPDATLPAVVVPTAQPTSPPAGAGSITVTTWVCPPGMTVENLAGELCQPRAAPVDALLSGPDGDHTVANATALETGWIWSALPYGEYSFAPAQLPEEVVSFFVPGLAAAGGSPGTAYTVAIDGAAPDIGLDLYLFSPARSGSIAIFVGLCPGDQSPEAYDPARCPGATGGFDIALISAATQQVYGAGEALSAGGWMTWSDLPFGDYHVAVNRLPRGYVLFVGPSGVSEPGGGFPVSISSSQPDVSATIYAFPASFE